MEIKNKKEMKGMLKNLLTIFLLTLMISMFLISTASAPSSTRMYVDPLAIIGESVGETFTVQVKVADVTDLTVFKFNLSYKTSVLEVVSSTVTPPSVWGSDWLPMGNLVDRNTGVYWVIVAKTGAAPSFSGSTSLVTITFRVIALGSSSLDLHGTGLLDSQYQEISHIIICVGDIDRDGDVDLFDFGRFANAYATSTGDPRYNPDADFDSDGDVDMFDFGYFAGNYAKTCG